MAAKSNIQKSKRKAARPNSASDATKSANTPEVASISAKRVAVQNLINMVVVMAGSGTVLLGLLAAKHFQI